MKTQKKLFIYLSVAFFFAVIGGTLFHELGHYSVARYFGYTASVSYKYSRYEFRPEIKAMIDSARNDKTNIQKYKARFKQFRSEETLITSGGPLANMGLGTLAFILLCIGFRKRQVSSWSGWLLVLLCFFWSRQVLNFIGFLFLLPGGNPHRLLRGDEAWVSTYLGLPVYLLGLVTCIVGGAMMLYVLFKYIRKEERLPFLAAGFCGGGLGILVWFFLLGPVLLP